MDREIIKFCFVFENCEYLEIKISDIAYCRLTNFEKRTECWDNHCTELDLIGDVYFRLKTSANNDYINPYTGTSTETVFERILSHDDITQIEVIYDDNSVFRYYPIWNDGDEWDNKYQTTKIDDNDTLEIVIKNDDETVIS